MTGSVYMENGRTELRPVEEEDLDEFLDMVNHPEVRPMTSGDKPINYSEEKDWFESLKEDDNVRFTITEEGEVIGNCGMDEKGKGASEIGIFIHPDHQNNGHGTRAVEMLLRHAFVENNVHKVYAKVMDHNEASKNLWESLGFTHEAKLDNHRWNDGSYVDVHIYSMWQEEFEDIS